MPNWCENDLTIKGKTKSLNELRTNIKGEGEIAIDFEKILPTPSTLKNTVSGSLQLIHTALFGSDEDIEYIIESNKDNERNAIPVALPEILLKAYPEKKIKAFCSVVRNQTAVTSDDGIPESKVLEYERIANNYNFNLNTYGMMTWYDWRVQEWGTKWNADCLGSSYQEKDGKAVYIISFSTAWSPPEPVIRELAKQYPELLMQLRYYEGGMGFQGRLRLKGDKTIEDRTWDYTGSRGG